MATKSAPKKAADKKKVVDTKDVEMKEVAPVKSQAELDALTIEDIKEQIIILEKSVVSKEPRFVMRVLRQLASTRRRLNDSVLRQLIKNHQSDSYDFKQTLLGYLAASESEDKPQYKSVISDVYIHMLTLVYLLDSKRINDGVPCAQALINKVMAVNKPSMQALGARCFFYYSRAFELAGKFLNHLCLCLCVFVCVFV